MIDILFIFLTVIIFIGLNGFFVAAEFSAVAARRTKINQLAAEGSRSARGLLPILESSEKKDKYLAATQLGITITSLVVGAFGQNVIAGELVEPISTFLSNANITESVAVANATARTIAITVVLTLLTVTQVVFGELFPKSLAIQYPEAVAVTLFWPMNIFLKSIDFWMIRFFNGSGRILLRLIPGTREGKNNAHSPQEIEILVTESHEGGMLDDQARQMLRNAFRLRDLTARQVMVHRTKMITAPQSTSVRELLQMAIEAGFTRIPLHADSTADDIIGFVHVKELFRLQVQGSEDKSHITRKLMYVPETMPVLEVWEKLNKTRGYVAIVFDEFGSTTGMVTFEDLIEEIFGELQDEFDDEMALIARDKQGRIHLRGDLLITDVNEYLELNLPEETTDTLGGLIISELGRPPKEGDEVTIGETIIQVEQVEDYSVQEVSLQLPTLDNVASYSEWEMTDYE